MAEIAEKAETYKSFCSERKITIQPYLVVLRGNCPQFFITYDSIFYKFTTLLDSVDILFKLFFIFDFSYPDLCKKLWIFIQRHFYKIVLSSDELNHTIIDAVYELSK